MTIFLISIGLLYVLPTMIAYLALTITYDDEIESAFIPFYNIVVSAFAIAAFMAFISMSMFDNTLGILSRWIRKL